MLGETETEAMSGVIEIETVIEEVKIADEIEGNGILTGTSLDVIRSIVGQGKSIRQLHSEATSERKSNAVFSHP
jgi:hypothetical protein